MTQKQAGIFALLAAAFIATLPFVPYDLSFLPKVLPIIYLLWVVNGFTNFRGRWLLLFALVFSGAGDVILEFRYGGAFIAGLVSFLTAHLFYIRLLVLDLTGDSRRYFLSFPALVPPAIMAVMLWPYLGALQVPVLVYVAVISAMLYAALNRREVNLLLMAGAASFVVSDAVLAVNKFHTPFAAARYVIMGTYYLAQILLVAGFLREHPAHKK